MDERTIEQLIAEKAHATYEWRMRQNPPVEGTDLADWLNAENNIQHGIVKDAEEVLSKEVQDKLKEGGY